MKERTLNALDLWKRARESFRIGTYLPIIDTLIAEVRKKIRVLHIATKF